jgi:uncharacterized cupredoxin-like copper-binding protein
MPGIEGKRMKTIEITAALSTALSTLLFAHVAAAHGNEDHAAIGVAGRAAQVTRSVDIDMSDAMRFTPSSVTVKQGETVRFIVRNSGRLKHEFVLGTARELKEHNELMKKFPEMEHADPNMVTVQPGKSGEVIWRFTRAGQVNFACLQPGHYDAGMKGAVMVTAVKKGAAK